MKKLILKFLSVSLIVSVLAGVMCGCTDSKNGRLDAKEQQNDVFANVEHRVIDVDVDLNSDSRIALTDFGLEVLKHEYSEGNIMISPLSILSALAMTANGASGITLEEFEQVMGMSVDEANAYLYVLNEMMNNSSSCKCNSANAIWVNKNMEIVLDKDYIQTMADYFSANLYYKGFDQTVVDDINSFVKENTNEMIPTIINDLRNDDAMVLVNALAFDGEWDVPYEEGSIQDKFFTNIDGSTSTVSMMNSTENSYIRSAEGYGLMKDYKDGEYKFVALLPNEDVDFNDFINNLTAEDLIIAMENPVHCEVNAYIPKFKSEYSTELSSALKDMGMSSAFDEQADFSSMTEGPNHLRIDYVIHKTSIEVSENGTLAAAATAIIMKNDEIAETSSLEVNLNRPFIYAIVDTETMTPIFIGMTTTL